MKRSTGALAALAVLLFAAGCQSDKEPDGYAKESFEKRPVPDGYGPPGGRPATPPPGKTGQ